MIQLQTSYTNKEAFRKQVIRWHEHIAGIGSGALIHIFAKYTGDERLRNELVSISRILDEELPHVPYVGAAAAGPIFDGYVSDENIIIICTVFEDSGTSAKVQLFHTGSASIGSFSSDLHLFEKSIGELKGIEIISTPEQNTITDICEALNQADPVVAVFGGLAVSDNEHPSYVFAKGTSFCRDASVLTAFSGKELHISTDRVTGWKPIGAPMKVTKASDGVLYELDGQPAYNVYYKYLRIPNDESIFYNALEFPFEVTDQTGAKYLRHARSCSADGAIVTATDIPQSSTVRITYGDPKTIISSVEAGCEKAVDFQPQVIAIYDCLGRKLFWGDNASNDTRPFYHVADTYGFCTLGEFMRQNGSVTLHNLSVIAACMREGDRREVPHEDHLHENHKEVMSLVSRLANFVDAATSDLMEANQKLRIMSITDRLTGLLNRGEIQARIDSAKTAALSDGTPFSLVMCDIDDFKHVNDTYGHDVGDKVLKSVSSVIQQIRAEDETISTGRWGGEEFMLSLPGKNADKAKVIAEQIRSRVEALQFPEAENVTISVGVTQLKSDDANDSTEIRVDQALYTSKRSGKNCVTII